MTTLWEVRISFVTWQAPTKVAGQIDGADTSAVSLTCVVLPLLSCITFFIPNCPIEKHRKPACVFELLETSIRKCEPAFFHNEGIASWIKVPYKRMIGVATHHHGTNLKPTWDWSLTAPNAGARLTNAPQAFAEGHATGYVLFVPTHSFKDRVSVTTNSNELVFGAGNRVRREEL